MMEKNAVKPRLTLVGAGPGDPDLITLKGVKALQDADVVLYDALVHPFLLSYAPTHAQLIFVGKRAGNHSVIQDEINSLIVQHALHSGHVVRLKGGDPFIFGRGIEEIEYAATFGIPSAVVPGISSSISVPELQMIPLTKRGVADSFWVVTGNTAAGETSSDLQIAATSSATVVILMGINKLHEVMTVFKSVGKQDTPVAIIQNGSLENERMIKGTVSTIEAMARAEGYAAPAIIVVGKVVV
jgi:uroporphyrin-III C-methyltransferase